MACRDGSASYRTAMTAGAPQAVQASDRFHLWRNLGRKIYEVVTVHRDCLPEPDDETTAPRTPEASWPSAPAEITPPPTPCSPKGWRRARSLGTLTWTATSYVGMPAPPPGRRTSLSGLAVSALSAPTGGTCTAGGPRESTTSRLSPARSPHVASTAAKKPSASISRPTARPWTQACLRPPRLQRVRGDPAADHAPRALGRGPAGLRQAPAGTLPRTARLPRPHRCLP
ncbi:hypothetical protein ACIRJS_40705 [Streptomyces sp. NPDC102340]|uniref:hypothetical protein n=1 Tax=unclassified Streptomyces TaxID=2593676 RepID=UPI0037FF643B